MKRFLYQQILTVSCLSFSVVFNCNLYCILLFPAIATVTAAPNGHILQYGDTPGGPLPMRPIYPRTQYNTQYTSAARVNAGDLPHTCPPSSKSYYFCYFVVLAVFK